MVYACLAKNLYQNVSHIHRDYANTVMTGPVDINQDAYCHSIQKYIVWNALVKILLLQRKAL